MEEEWIWQDKEWPHFLYDEVQLAPLIAEARVFQAQLLGMVVPLTQDLSAQTFAEVLLENGLTTSAIENEALDPQAVRSSIARHLHLETAGLPVPPRAVDGLIEMLLDATRNFEKPLTWERLCGWQAALFPSGYSGIVKIRTGMMRGPEPMHVVSGVWGAPHIHFTAPPVERLEYEVEVFLQWFNHSWGQMDGLIRAGLAHLWFVTLHPFEDGNGRLTRAITDLVLSQDERLPMRYFSLSAQILEERQGYYDILERTQRGGLDVTLWLVWFLTQSAAAIRRAQTKVNRTLKKVQFWLQHRMTDMNERQRKALNRLLEEGPGGFVGGLNTRKYVSLNKTSRATAYRELTDLVEKGCLQPTAAKGRSQAYEIVWPHS